MTGDGELTGKTILLVDDSPRIRPLVREILKDLHWPILEAETAEQALETAEAYRGEIGLLLSDITLPGMSGVDLAAALRRRYPKMQVLLMSGYTLPSSTSKDLHFIEKPFRPEALLAKVRAIFGLAPEGARG